MAKSPGKTDLHGLAEAFAAADKARRKRACEAANLGMAIPMIEDPTVQAAHAFYMMGMRTASDAGMALQKFAEALRPTEADMAAATAKGAGDLATVAGALTAGERETCRIMGIPEADYAAAKMREGGGAAAAAVATLTDEEKRAAEAFGVSPAQFAAAKASREKAP